MKVLTAATEEEASALVASIDKALGYPMKGAHIGEGRHVDMPDEWDGKGEVPPGWSAGYTAVHTAEGKELVVPLDEAAAARVLLSLDRLEKQDSDALTAALAERTEKDIAAEGYTRADAKVETAPIKGR